MSFYLLFKNKTPTFIYTEIFCDIVISLDVLFILSFRLLSLLNVGNLATLKDQLVAVESPIAKFIVPDWGDKVVSGMRLSYRPARLHGWQGGSQF